MVTGSFKVMGISTAANGSEDHLVRNPDILQELQDAEDSGEELVSDEDSDHLQINCCFCNSYCVYSYMLFTFPGVVNLLH